MTHDEAVQTKAAERYALDEMTPQERDAFEEHYFGCPPCASDVRDAMTIAAALRAEKRSRSNVVPMHRQSRAPWLAAAAMLAIVAVLGYQNVILRRREPQGMRTHLLHTFFLQSESRGEAETVVDGSKPFAVSFDIAPRPNATRYVVTIADAAGRVVVTEPVSREEARESVQLFIPGGVLKPGRYLVTAHSEPAVGPDSVWSFEVR
jgi:hypothetical protein